LFLELLFQ